MMDQKTTNIRTPVRQLFCRMPNMARQRSTTQSWGKCTRTRGFDLNANSSEDGQECQDPVQGSVADRIRKAKEYRLKKSQPSTSSQESSRGGETTPPLAEADTAVLDEFNRNLAQYGEELAVKQQETFAAALNQTRNEAEASGLSEEASEQQMLQQRQQQEDYIKRNAKHLSPTLHAKMQRGESSARPDTFSRQRTDDTAGPLSGPTLEDMERQKAAVSGSDSKPASYLASIAQEKSEAAGLRPEIFTIRKEEEVKARGVEMITKDRTYDPQKEQAAPYKPKVSSWGVFPRPQDISKAYGGGKTIQPASPEEAEARAKERSEKLQATILEYRKKQGLYIDPEEEAQWMAAYQAGLEMMQRGQLQGASEAFDRVSKAVPPRSKLGGEAQLQKAICLDSAGRNDEAYKIYMTLERHPASEIQKGAKKMLFGFRAADNLKAKSMTYSASSQEWEQYFTRFSSDWNSGYVETAEADKFSTYIAAAVIIAPLLFAAYLIFR